jgi:hypothetical protein
MQQREAIARHYAGDDAINRVLGSARQQWLPSGQDTRGPQDVVTAVPIAGAKLTLGTLLVALREAPLVIVVLSAVFLASETWQFFARLDGWEYAKVIGGVIFLMAVILVLGLREEARRASTVPAADGKTPLTDLERPLVDAGFGDPPPGLRPPWRSRASLRASHVTRLVLVCVGVGIAAAAIFALLGATAVSPQLSGSWATRVGETPNYRPHELLNISLLGKHAETVTTELLLVCGAIGAIAALAFSVELVTGERLRGELLQKRFEGYRTAFRAWARLYHGKPPPEPE